MTSFAESGDGLRIAYEVAGQGAPVLLIHGFGSSRAQNWRATGWYKTLGDAGFQVIAMDCRGHGDSDKPHDPARYAYTLMAGDARAVLAAAGTRRAALLGYSMGGHLGIALLMNHPGVVEKLALGGVGESYLHAPFGSRFAIAEALEVPDAGSITNPVQKMFRAFADQPGKDRAALAACARGDRHGYTAAELGQANRPVLVVCGSNDLISGPPGPLAAAIPGAYAVTIAGRDHMSAVGDKGTKAAVLEFLQRAN